MILDSISKPNDIKKIPPEQYKALAEEIRSFLVESVAETGGHLASNLGAVELTMALHLVLDLPKDRIVWDVGHQSYTHKLLTGRKEEFATLRQKGGLAGFPKRRESSCDAFDTGHSSTSISAGLGLVQARDLKGEDYHVVSVIGDGAMTGGMAYEAMNNASHIRSNFIIILNDNEMSISESTGGMARYLSRLRLSRGYNNLKKDVTEGLQKVPGFGEKVYTTISRAKSSLKQLMIPGMLFENLGLTYLGPIDGHDVPLLVDTLKNALDFPGPVLLHVRTVKGRGYEPAERRPDLFHGVGPFYVKTGEPKKKKTVPSWTDVFSETICSLARENPKLCAVTAAMEDGTGLKRFSGLYKNRFFDVGIAEEHAVTFAAGLAAEGMQPVVAVYSTFLQRAYDQIVHDVCLTGLPVIFAVDRAGLVGADGETHQGILDLSFLSTIPGMTVIAPKNGRELEEAFAFALKLGRPAAIRYPRGDVYAGFDQAQAPFEYGKCEWLKKGSTPVTLVALGSMVKTAAETAELLKTKGADVSLVNARFCAPLDFGLLDDLARRPGLAVFMEENVRSGGFGEHCAAYLAERGSRCRVMIASLPDTYVEQGRPEELLRENGMDPQSIADRILARKEEWNE